MTEQPDTDRHTLFEDAQALLTGAVVVAIGLVLLKQAGLLTGGTTGLAFLIHYFTGSNFGLTLFLINAPFYALAWFRMGRAFTLKTFVAVALLATLTNLLPTMLHFDRLNPVLTAVATTLSTPPALLTLVALISVNSISTALTSVALALASLALSGSAIGAKLIG